MNYANNPSYTPLHTFLDKTVIYGLGDDTQLSLARKTALDAQAIFADGVITKPLLKKICQEMIKEVNKKDLAAVAVWANNLLYRCSYPVDEDVALRAAACVLFIDGEDAETCTTADIEKKVALIKSDSKAYDFFLPMGLALVPAYRPFVKESSRLYFQRRKQTLESLTPQQLANG